MTLSIVIPCYKVELYLDKCLESVCHYNSNEIEIILVDDGSPDSTPHLCDQWAKKEKRIKVIHQNNGGLSVARNAGLDAASGDYIWFIDSDDWIADNAVEHVISYINLYPDIEVFITPLIWTYKDSRKNWADINLEENTIMTGRQYIIRHPDTIGASPRNIIKRNILNSAKIRFFPGIVHEDGLFGHLLYNYANKVMVLKDSIYYYRQRENSIMHTRDVRSAYSMITIHQEMMKYMNENIAIKEQLSFRQRYVHLFHAAMTMIWSLHNTPEAKKFLADTRSYRISECMKCSEHGNLWTRGDMHLLAYHPVAYVYVHGWKKMLQNKIKGKLRSNLTKTRFYNNLSSIRKHSL